jgi:formylglycine-generating enzyme
MMISADASINGMVLIPSGSFDMGADNNQTSPDGYQKHTVTVNAFI